LRDIKHRDIYHVFSTIIYASHSFVPRINNCTFICTDKLVSFQGQKVYCL